MSVIDPTTFCLRAIGTCPQPLPPQSRIGVRRQNGFQALLAKTVAARWIVGGWTGVGPNAASTDWPWNNPELLTQFGFTKPLDFHSVGQVVKRRASESSVSTFTAARDTTEAPPASGSNADWTAGGASGGAVNTYIATGFWRSGNAVRLTLQVGDLIYRTRPNALETSDDWSIELYECIKVLAVDDPILDPAGDPTHFRRFGVTSDLLQRQFPALVSGNAVLNTGEIIYVGGSENHYFRALRDNVSRANYATLTDFEVVNVNRPLFAELFAPVPTCQTVPEFWKRYSELDCVNTLTPVGGGAGVGGPDKYFCGRKWGEVTQAFGGVLTWGGAGLPPVVGTSDVATFTVKCFYQPNPARGGYTNLQSDSITGAAPALVHVGDRIRVNVDLYDINAPHAMLRSETYYFTAKYEYAPTAFVDTGSIYKVVNLGAFNVTSEDADLDGNYPTRFRLSQIAFVIPDGHNAEAGAGVTDAMGWTSRAGANWVHTSPSDGVTMEFRTMGRVGGNYPNAPAHQINFHRSQADATIFKAPLQGDKLPPDILSARLTAVTIARTEIKYTWRVIAADSSTCAVATVYASLDVPAVPRLIEGWDSVKEFDFEQRVGVTSEYTFPQVFADIVMGDWGNDSGASASLQFGVAGFLGTPPAGLITLGQFESGLTRREGRWPRLVGPTYRYNVANCGNPSANHCETRRVAQCGFGSSVTLSITFDDLGISYGITDGAACPP